MKFVVNWFAHKFYDSCEVSIEMFAAHETVNSQKKYC